MQAQLKNIIKGCISSDRKSQQQLYEYTYKSLSTAVALYTKDASEKDWVFNVGMLKVFNSLSNYNIGTNFLAWARVILVRTAIDNIRKNKTHDQMLAPLETNESAVKNTEINEALNKIETEEVIKIIQRLDQKERLIFTMYEIEGFTHVEIERETGIKKNTSKWLLAKAKKSLKVILKNSSLLNSNIHG